jgi:hypothetical protein
VPSLYERIAAENVERLVSSFYGLVEVAAALLDHGANIEARDAKGQTPLCRAVNCRQLPVVQLLMQRSADPRDEDNRRVKPLDVARTTEMKRALAGTSPIPGRGMPRALPQIPSIWRK